MGNTLDEDRREAFLQIEQLAHRLMAKVAAVAETNSLVAADVADVVVDIAVRYGCSEADAVGVLLDRAATLIWEASDVSYGPPSASLSDLDRMRDEVSTFYSAAKRLVHPGLLEPKRPNPYVCSGTKKEHLQ